MSFHINHGLNKKPLDHFLKQYHSLIDPSNTHFSYPVYVNCNSVTLPHTQKQKVGGADEISLLTPEEEEDVVTENVSHPLLRVPFNFILMILVFDFTS